MAESSAVQAAPSSAASSSANATLDACIVNYANARRACYGASCSSCITSLTAIEQECMSAPCELGDSARGSLFMERFRNYRYVDVGRQCIHSVAIPEFERLDELTCGALQGHVRVAQILLEDGALSPTRSVTTDPACTRCAPCSCTRPRPFPRCAGCFEDRMRGAHGDRFTSGVRGSVCSESAVPGLHADRGGTAVLGRGGGDRCRHWLLLLPRGRVADGRGLCRPHVLSPAARRRGHPRSPLA